MKMVPGPFDFFRSSADIQRIFDDISEDRSQTTHSRIRQSITRRVVQNRLLGPATRWCTGVCSNPVEGLRLSQVCVGIDPVQPYTIWM